MDQKTVETYLVIKASVTIDDEIRHNHEQYISGKPSTDEELAQSLLFAYLNPHKDTMQWELDSEDNYFDGCCNLKGKIKNLRIDEHAEIW